MHPRVRRVSHHKSWDHPVVLPQPCISFVCISRPTRFVMLPIRPHCILWMMKGIQKCDGPHSGYTARSWSERSKRGKHRRWRGKHKNWISWLTTSRIPVACPRLESCVLCSSRERVHVTPRKGEHNGGGIITGYRQGRNPIPLVSGTLRTTQSRLHRRPHP